MSGERSVSQMTRSGPDLEGLGRGSSANLIGSAVMAGTTFALTFAVTRGLSREQAGLFFAATSVFVLASNLGQLGTNTALVYFVSRARSLGTPERISRYVRTAMGPVLVTAILTALVFFIWAGPIGALITPGHGDTTAAYLRSLALFIPLAGVENILLAASRGLGTMRPSVLVEQVGRSTVQLMLVVAAIMLSSQEALGWAWAAAYLPAAVWAVMWWRRLAARELRRSRVDRSAPLAGDVDRAAPTTHLEARIAAAEAPSSPGPADSQSLGREFWRFSGPRALASVGQVTMQRLDIILVAAISGAVSAAIYTAATRFVVVGQMANRAISTAVQPRLSHALARGDVVETNHLYRVSTGWLMLLTWPLYLTLIVYGDDLLSLFGPGYATGREVLVILAGSMLWATACGMVDMVLNMGGRTTWNLANVFIALSVNLTLDLWLIPKIGLLGAAIGWAAAIVVSNLVALLQVSVVLGLHPFGRSTVLAVVLPTVCYGAIPVAVGAVIGAGFAHLLVGLGLGTIAYAGCLTRWRQPLELGALIAVRRRGRGRAAPTS